jgi:hypothetical protein
MQEITVKEVGTRNDGTKVFMVMHGNHNPDPRLAGKVEFLTAEEVGQYFGS